MSIKCAEPECKTNTDKINSEYCNNCKEWFEAINKAHTTGLMDGCRKFAWWKDGTQYVGNCGTTLHEALDIIEKEKEKII